MPAAGAAADSPDQKGDKGQVRSSTAGWLEGDTGATEKAPARHGREQGVGPCPYNKNFFAYFTAKNVNAIELLQMNNTI